jgi:hypothetical protein
LPARWSTKPTKLPVLVFVLGAAILMLGGVGTAQEPPDPLRQRRDGVPSIPAAARVAAPEAAGLGIRGTAVAAPGGAAPAGAAPAAQAPAAARSTRRQGVRRTRQPAVLPVRGLAQIPTASPNVAREVQGPVFGLPDPDLPERLRLRRVLERDPLVARYPPGRIPERDPYASLGYRFGPVTLFPAVQQDIGYDSNPNRSSSDRKGSILSRTEGELRLQSDWSRHELTGLLRGAYTDFPNVKEADRPDATGRLNLRLDASRDTRIDLETRYFLDTQRPGSPDLNASVRERPLVHAGGASAAITRRFNRLSLGLRGNVDKVVYEDAELTNGSILDQSDRDRTQYELRLRASYELKPGFTPFVEPIVDTRVYDRRIDNSGFRRSSDGIGARAGSTFEITRLVTGEASAGYQVRKYDDNRLKDLRGPIVEAALIWSPTALTTVRLRGSTQLGETSLAESSGALLSQATLEVQHDLRRNVSIIGAVTFSETEYQGVQLKEDGFAGTVRLDYRLTRSVAVRASFTHERLNSSEPGSDYTATVYLVGLRFQP